jgi:broad specificity phosphatase PhoE
MIRVYLVRHAIAEDRDSARWPDDSERPLTRRGLVRTLPERVRRARSGDAGRTRSATAPFVSSNRSAPSSPATRSEASECALD